MRQSKSLYALDPHHVPLYIPVDDPEFGTEAATVRESVKVAGLVERARVVRAFVGAVLGPGHPCGDDAVLLVSELFGNSVQHSGSGLPGETVTVTTACIGVVRVEVADRSGLGVPQLRLAGGDAEGGRGLGLVAKLAAR